MKASLALCTILQLVTLSQGACTKDACYNHVAVQSANGPNRPKRQADCRSILKTVVDDSVTTTIFSYTTGEPVTSTTFITDVTTTSITATSLVAPSNAVKKRFLDTEDRDSVLGARDNIVIKGNKPDYAIACRSNQDYAIACLCAGIKAGSQQTLTQVLTIRSTIISTKTSTSLTKTIATTSTTFILPTACSVQQKADCTDQCFCNIAANSRTRVCYDSGFSCQPCETDDDCLGRNNGVNPYCVIESNQSCQVGRKICVGISSQRKDFCPKNAPF